MSANGREQVLSVEGATEELSFTPVRHRLISWLLRHAMCIDCAKCAKACPSALPVDRLVTIRSAECLGYLQCVAACPAESALFLSPPQCRGVPAWAVGAGVTTLFVGAYVFARWTGHWNTDLPERVYFEIVPHADDLSHP